MAHVNTRILEASNTRQQTSNGSDVLEFVMNKIVHAVGAVTLRGANPCGSTWRSRCGLPEGILPQTSRACLSDCDTPNVKAVADRPRAKTALDPSHRSAGGFPSDSDHLIYTRGGPMPHRLCPRCPIQGRLLDGPSQDAFVEYWRCDQCSHVWSHERANPTSPHKDVTVPSDKAAP